ncbi:conserved hypothetical protein [Culex quinquefasciatus]|uniref:Uncharacterized protein n=1 Tax=Culex quinquefasciatus TaxID=7176 RepID=B0W4S3_CULQU|nr:conserved hypothetical protein [Culex quinquefasciatus]|eukprot:XP_001843707.1 conserved hypothetical protein [Culex quinquefasciatus]
MSKALVKKALAVVEGGLLKNSPKNDTQTKDSSSKKRKPDAPLATPDLMPQHHKIIKYVGKRGKKEARELLRRPESLTVGEARKRLQNRRNHTEENVQKLLLLSSAEIGREASAKMIKRAQTGRYVVKADEFLEKKKKEPASAFTEEDFDNFAKELEELC